MIGGEGWGFDVYRVEERDGARENVTAAMRAGLHEPVLAPGEVRDCRVYLRCGRFRRGQRAVAGRARFDARHYWDGRGRDSAALAAAFR